MVKFYTDDKKRVRPITKRKAKPQTLQTGVPHLAIPKKLRKETLTDSRISHNIDELYNDIEQAKSNGQYGAVAIREREINYLINLRHRTKKEQRNTIMLIMDEIDSAKKSKQHDSTDTWRSEVALERVKDIVNIHPKAKSYQENKPKIEYVLAQKEKQTANIIGYHPESEKLVWMKPSEFLALTPPIHTFDEPSKTNIAERIKSGKEIDALWLDVNVDSYKVQQHEGRHRAKVAQELGVEKIPVVLYAKNGNEFVKSNELPPVELLIREDSKFARK